MTGLNYNDIDQALASAQLEDQTVSVGGGNFTFKRLPMGKHVIRLMQYIEVGEQPQGDYNGKPKPDAPNVVMGFEFLSKRCVEQREDGKGEYAPRKVVIIKKSFHEKAAYRKLFEKLRCGDTSITHMAQMVGKQHWVVTVEWTTKVDGKEIVLTAANVEEYEERAKANPDNREMKIWDNIRNKDGFMIAAPVRSVFDDEGEDTGVVVPIPCREPVGPMTMFLWDDPMPVLWDSIFIEGSYTKTVEGKDIEVSKNRHQEMCMAASNFAGSPLDMMLGGVDDLKGMQDNGDVLDDGKEPEPKKEVADEKPSEQTAEQNEMEELGL